MLQEKIVKFYGRKSSNLTTSAKEILTNLLPKYLFDIIELHNNVIIHKQYKKIYLEIGFGNGYHIFQQAKHHPDILCIGVEVYLNGISTLLKELKHIPLNNLKIFNQDIRFLWQELPKNFIDKIFILFPDPWPKKRHHKRRIINQINLGILSSILKNQGIIRMATDHSEYKDYILQNFLVHNDFKKLNPSTINNIALSEPFEEHFLTKYEVKALKQGILPFYLEFKKVLQN